MSTDPYAVTAAELAEYGNCRRHHMQQLMRPKPDSLWYYTTASTFAQMMENKTIWATQISCLNDHMEFRHGVKLVREALREYAGHADEDTQWLAKRVDEALSFDGAPISQFFVLCMSEAKDDLSQWRAYGGGENGVSLELCAPLLEPVTQNGADLRPVVYVEDAQHGLAADLARWTIGFFKMGQTPDRPDREKWADAFLAAWEQQVIYFAPLLKDKAFEGEKEWRLIISYGKRDWPLLRIQQRQSLISRHLILSFGSLVPLSSVMVGPCRHPDVSRVSVGSILEAKGYPIDQFDTGEPNKVRVSSSKVPFQAT